MENAEKYRYLGRVNSPQQLKKLPEAQIPAFAAEIRRYLVDRIRENGGHLASNLGVVELTLALHRVFCCPHDHIIWDVGHQSYVHKLLTGRFQEFDTLRQNGGISGFTRRDESPFDCFGAGHSSTSISAALGFAQADKLSGSDAYTVAVVGDGAFTGGMIHEALNNCDRDLHLIIIINENEMSISKNIGRFATNLARIRRAPGYIRTKRATARAVQRIPLVGNGLYTALVDTKQTLKNALYGSNYFEDLGLYYLGPCDGNDYNAVEALLREAKNQNESVVIHLKTKKGKGYLPAEQCPNLYHSMYPGQTPEKPCETFSSVFGRTLTDLADRDSRICAITAAMCEGTGLVPFREKHAARFFDVGIAEEHAVTFAAGLAAEGKRPAVAVYSTFLQRSYDQILHDVALQHLPVVFCVDRAGLNAHDGTTHHGIFDLGFFSQITGIRVYMPVTFDGLRRALNEAFSLDAPCAVRYAGGGEKKRLANACHAAHDGMTEAVISDACVIRSGGERCDGVIVTLGMLGDEALEAAERLKPAAIRVILCEKLTDYVSLSAVVCGLLPSEKCPVLFAEEGIYAGGFCMNLADAMRTAQQMQNRAYTIYAIKEPYRLPEPGENYLQLFGLDAVTLARTLSELMHKQEEK